MVGRTVRDRGGDDSLQGRVDRLPTVLYLDDRDRGAASGLRLRHEDSRRPPRRGAAADRSDQRAIMDRAFRHPDPHRDDPGPAAAAPPGPAPTLYRGVRERTG